MKVVSVTFPNNEAVLEVLKDWSWQWPHDDSLMFDCSSVDDYEGLSDELSAVNPAILQTIRNFNRSGITFLLINWL